MLAEKSILMLQRPTLPNSYLYATIGGFLAILLWASNIAFSKSVIEQHGLFNTAIYIFLFSGFFNLFLLILVEKKGTFLAGIKSLPLSWYLTSGLFFVLSISMLILAIGKATSTRQLIIVSILNYSWPILIYLFKIPILKTGYKIAPLVTGILLSLIGIVLALLEGYNFSEIKNIFQSGDDNPAAYALAFLNSVSWALYSNLTIRYKKNDDRAGIPVLFILTGVAFLVAQTVKGQLSTISPSSVFSNPEMIYMIIGPTSLAYFLWYLSMKYGNRNLVISLSFFIPLLSVLITSIKFHMAIGTIFWVAIVLLIVGSYLCYKSFESK